MRAIVVKLGGSVITRKRKISTLRRKVLIRLGHELQEGWAKAGHPPLVVIHGAGSFGHPWAEKWSLAKAPPGPRGDNRTRGAAITSMQVRRLHNEVLRALTDAGLPAISVPPAATAMNEAGQFKHLGLDPITEMLKAGMVPVTFGDVVRDASWGFSILSGDRIALELARTMPVDRVVFVTDVEGILDGQNPPKVIHRLTSEVAATLRPVSSGPDVTGGIQGKALRMLEIREQGASAGLVSGLASGRLISAMTGVDTYGSWT